MRTCTIDGCARRHNARGLCITHYARWRTHGTTADRVSPTATDRLLAKVRRDPIGGCWLWTAQVDVVTGYGHFFLSMDRRNVTAHRAAYELLVGPVPAGLELDHLCRVRRCVNPKHLEPVTPLENMRRMVAATRGNRCYRGHGLTEGNVVWNEGKRRCRECRLVNQRARAARIRENARAARRGRALLNEGEAA